MCVCARARVRDCATYLGGTLSGRERVRVCEFVSVCARAHCACSCVQRIQFVCATYSGNTLSGRAGAWAAVATSAAVVT